MLTLISCKHRKSQGIAQTQKLLEVINALTPTSSTDTGRSWMIKALHPSDPMSDCIGVPDGTGSATVMMNYQSTYTISPPSSLSTTTWQFALDLLPDPVAFGYVWTANAVSAQASATNLFNTQVAPLTGAVPAGFAPYDLLMQSLIRMGVVKWRLAYASVSLYQDGPDLANQGTLAAAQTYLDYRYISVCNPQAPAPQTAVWAAPDCMVFSQTAIPSFTQLQAMPNAYFGQSKFGCYLPLHLDYLDKWRGLHDLSLVAAPTPDTVFPGCYSIATTSGNGGAGVWPFPGAYSAAIRTGTAPLGCVAGSMISKPCNKKIGVIAGVNLSPQTSFSMFVRQGWELMVTPDSSFTSLQHIAPRLDNMALENYHRIVRELKDAYPVEFNDLGKLWDVIKGAARTILPVLTQMPGPVGAIAGAGQAIMKILDQPKAANRTTAPAVRQSSAPAAKVEEAQQVVKALSLARPVSRVQGKGTKRKQQPQPQGGGGRKRKGRRSRQ